MFDPKLCKTLANHYIHFLSPYLAFLENWTQHIGKLYLFLVKWFVHVNSEN